jgi:hypothetical protein
VRRTIAFSAFVGLVLAPAIAVAASTANSKTFADSVGENAAAPDVTSIAVANDDAGLITFQVNVSNRPALTQDMVALMFIDSVPGTGDPESLGADFAIQLDPAGVALFKWDGTNYTFVSSSVSFTYAAGGPTIRIGAGDLGKPKTINFTVLLVSGITFDANGEPNLSNAAADVAPDFGVYAYDVLTTFSLKAAGFSTSPSPAKPGKAFSVGLAATQSDTGGLVQQGRVTCNARIAGVPVPLKTSRLRNGVGACVWSIPKTVKGKSIQGTITVVVAGAQVKRSFSARITT